MDNEIQALHDNDTWGLVPALPILLVVNGSSMKLKSSGAIKRYKARLMA